MARRSLVVSVVTEEKGLLDTDVGGCTARDYLLESLSKRPGAEVVLAACSAAELNAKTISGADLLVVDGRAWFSSEAVTGAFLKGRSAAKCTRIVEPSPIHVRGGLRTLAVYFPADRRGAKRFEQRPASKARGGLERILRPGPLEKAKVILNSALDATQPPFLIDSYAAIAELEKHVQLERAKRALKDGVRIRDPRRVYIRGQLECGSGVEIEIDVIIEGHVVLEDGVKVDAHSIIRNSRIGKDTKVHPFSLVDGSTVGRDTFIGPYGRVRPGSVIGNNVQIGNYVEIKSSRIGDGSRINHHSFIGDAVLGTQVTIGAGSITCNHDGTGINETIIERGAYVGSGCNLVAPLRVGEGATIGAGSTVTRDVPAAKLTVARAPQIVVEGWPGPKSRSNSK